MPASDHAASSGFAISIPGVGSIADILSDIINGLVDMVLEPVVSWLSEPFVRWLVHVPNYAASGGKLEELRQTTSGVSFGLIAAMITLATIHYWATGLSSTSSGGGAPLEAIIRAVGAGLFIASWPFVYFNAVELSNLLSKALVSESSIGEAITSLAAMLSVADWAGVGAILKLLIAVIFLLVVLSVTLLKIGFAVGLAVIYIGLPLAIALWVLPSTSWIAHLCLRTFTAIIVVPIVWSLCICALAAIMIDFAIFDSGTTSTAAGTTGTTLVDEFSRPLVFIVGWFMLIKSAQLVLRTAGALPGGGGGVAGMFAHLAMYAAFHMPGGAGAGAGAGAAAGATPGPPQPPPPPPPPPPDPPGARPMPGMRELSPGAPAALPTGPAGPVAALPAGPPTASSAGTGGAVPGSAGGAAPSEDGGTATPPPRESGVAAERPTGTPGDGTSDRVPDDRVWSGGSDGPVEAPAPADAEAGYGPFDGQTITTEQGTQALETLDRTTSSHMMWNTVDTLGSSDYGASTRALREFAAATENPEAQNAYHALAAMDGPQRSDLAASWRVEIVEQPKGEPS